MNILIALIMSFSFGYFIAPLLPLPIEGQILVAFVVGFILGIIAARLE